MKKEPFTKGLNFYKLFWIFVIGSVAGTLYESILAFFQTGTWLSRQGMLYGPFNQVYGFGAVLFMVTIYQMNNLWLVFGFGTLFGGVFEYLSSLLQEFVFHSVSWNYSSHFLNFQGRTSVPVALGWGLLGVVFVKWIAPFLNQWINRIPKVPGKLITWVFFGFLIFDLGITGLATWRQKERQDGVNPRNQIEVFLDKMYPDSYLEKIFPNKKET